MAQTSLNSTGVASSGALSLQSNGTTEAIGISTAQVATFVKDAVINGATVGRGAGSVSTNTAVGASALATVSSSAHTTAVGNAALNLIASNGYATAVGSNALNKATGANNTAVGAYAGQNTTTGADNLFLGEESAVGNTTGSYNVAVGRTALYSNTTASNNTAVGYQAAYTNSTGAQIVALGYQAVYAATGSYNVGIGYRSLYNTTTGVENTSVGYNMVTNTTGSYNTAIGHNALHSNTTASNNTAVGYQAGYSNTTGVNDSFFGWSAGYSNTTGSENTFVGNYAGYFVTTGSKNSILGRYNGNQGGLDIRTASNYIVLSDGDGNPRMYYNGSSNYWTTPNLIWAQVGVTPDATGRDNARILNSTSGTTGTVTLYIGNASITTSSDVRLKENIVDTQRNATEILSQLRVVDHTWNDPSDTSVNNRNSRGVWMGLIAQEAQPIIPWLVNKPLADEDEEGNQQYWHMDYGYAVPLLIKAIQELKAEFDAYKATHP
jgi:hypothetical protein